jgi:hypothetical protein
MDGNKLGTARDNRKAAGIRWGWDVKPGCPPQRRAMPDSPVAALTAALAALPRSCPFGAELGTEPPHARKTLLPLCARGGDRVAADRQAFRTGVLAVLKELL